MTFLGFDPKSRLHDDAGHPESAARAEAIRRILLSDPVAARLPWLAPDRPLTRDEALTIHTPRLWLNLETAQAVAPTRLDPDTYFVAGTWDAARGTARLGLLAAERVWRSTEAGFVIARPPGHHATADRSMGFCHFNNVALAARHLLRLGARRVLVLDHDVHHGNGTQEIFYESSEVLYQSFHLAPHYPGTGAVEEIGSGAGSGFTLNAPLRAGDGVPEARSLLLNVFLPVAKEFRPDVILVSAGFDSLAGDPLGGLRLSPGFYGEIVHRLLRISPRLVAFLEGGYQLDRIPAAALAEVHAMAGRVAPEAQDVEAPASEPQIRRLLGPFWSCLR